MKSLKIALKLVVFCLTVSGSSYDNKQEIDNTFEVNENNFEFTGPIIKKGAKLPSQQGV